jgi:enoyl-CoA hydratase/carnithine racemase
MGLINQISKNTEELESKVTEIATKIASKSPTAIKMGKRAFNRQIELGVSDAYDIASDTMVRNLLEDDADEGISAFLQKRSPVWREVV